MTNQSNPSATSVAAINQLLQNLELGTGECNLALSSLSDDTIFFPPLPTQLTICPNDVGDRCHIKGPNLHLLNVFGDDDFLAQLLLNEALVLHRLAQQDQPNIVHFYGIQVARGRITGLVLEKHQRNLKQHVELGLPIAHPVIFMRALASAVFYMHSQGLAHNDLTPENVMVSDDGMPVVIDFGLSAPFSTRLTSMGTPEWVRDIDAHIYSNKGHDFYALEKLFAWLKERFID
jgi:serine/threonine protein kinase